MIEYPLMILACYGDVVIVWFRIAVSSLRLDLLAGTSAMCLLIFLSEVGVQI